MSIYWEYKKDYENTLSQNHLNDGIIDLLKNQAIRY